MDSDYDPRRLAEAAMKLAAESTASKARHLHLDGRDEGRHAIRISQESLDRTDQFGVD